MSTRVVDRVDEWDERSVADGYRGLQNLADSSFSGVVRAGGAELYMTNGTIVGVERGTIENFESASARAYEAPSPALPLLAVMQQRSDEVRAQYYTEDTPIAEVDTTLSDGGFTGYIELSENVLSGDYYQVYHGGNSMSVAFVGNSSRLIHGDEAFETANDEVGIYEVKPVDVDAIEIPEPVEEPEPDPEQTGGAVAPDPAVDDEAGDQSMDVSETQTVVEDAEEPTDASGETPAATASPDQQESSPAQAATADASNEPTEAENEAANATSESTDSTSEPADQSATPATPDERTEQAETTGGRQAAESPSESEPSTEAAGGANETVEPEQPGTAQSPDVGMAGAPTGGSAGRSQRTAAESAVDLETRAIPSLDPDRTVSKSRTQTGPTPERAGQGATETTQSQPGGRQETQTGGTTQGRTQQQPQREASQQAQPSAGQNSQREAGQQSQPGHQQHSSQQSQPGHQQHSSQQSQPSQETQQSAQPSQQGDAAGTTDAETASADPDQVIELREKLDERDDEIDRLETELEDATDRAEELETELEAVRRERDDLAEEVERLESDLETLETELGAATDAEVRLTRAEALNGTDIFIRYHSKGDATLEKAHSSGERKGKVVENLRLEKHTQFDADSASVSGREYDAFLEETIEYQFVKWVVEDLLFEIRDTGHDSALKDLYDALPKVDRAELNGVIEVTYTEDGQETRTQETFDVVLRDRMGNPLLVANLNDSREAATEGMMEQLITAAERVGQSKKTFACAFLVTESFFEPAALETASEATKGGLLSRDSRSSFVNLSRKQGYHLCLVEARNQNFHLAVPEL